MQKKDISDAIARGEKLAGEALKLRTNQTPVSFIPVRNDPTVGETYSLNAPTETLSLKTPAFNYQDVLLAEGDSWFDYPLFDTLDALEDEYGYDIKSVAHRGNTLEDMAYTQEQGFEFTRKLDKMKSYGLTPKCILLSAGGNDIAGDTFSLIINHINSPIKGSDKDILQAIINKRLKIAYITLISKISHLCMDRYQKKIPILIHGYDSPYVDGRGFLGGGWILPGPWLEPGFREKGFSDVTTCNLIIYEIIETFNGMLHDLANLPNFKGFVHYINLQGTLKNDKKNYRKYWADEMHPSKEGFKIIAEVFDNEIKKL